MHPVAPGLLRFTPQLATHETTNVMTLLSGCDYIITVLRSIMNGVYQINHGEQFF